MVVVAAHTPCRGAMRRRILGSHTPPCHRRMVITTQFSVLPCCTATQTSAVPLQVPAAWRISLRRGPTPKRVPHKVPNRARCTFCHVSRFASPLHGVPIPQYGRFKSFRVSEHRFMGHPVPQCGRFESVRVSRGAQSRNFGCANNKYIVSPAMVVCCRMSCVSRPKKTPKGIDPSTTFTSSSISSRQRLHCVGPKPPAIA